MKEYTVRLFLDEAQEKLLQEVTELYNKRLPFDESPEHVLDNAMLIGSKHDVQIKLEYMKELYAEVEA